MLRRSAVSGSARCVVGKYLSTKIFSFSMHCFGCGGPLVIQTDPKGCDYELAKGCEKKAGFR